MRSPMSPSPELSPPRRPESTRGSGCSPPPSPSLSPSALWVTGPGRGVPVRGLGLVFLALLGATAAEATQAIGALLLLGLLAAPAGAAQRLTANPYRGLGLSAVLAVLCTWAGLSLSYVVPALPP